MFAIAGDVRVGEGGDAELVPEVPDKLGVDVGDESGVVAAAGKSARGRAGAT